MPAPAIAIEVRGLTFRYPGADEDTLRGVDLRIEAGDFVAVVGGNGSGKTTLCKTFNGLVPHFWSGDLAGSVRVLGQDTAEVGVAELSHSVGYVFQDFGNQLVRPTVRDDVSFAPVNFGLADWEERTTTALETLDITSLADRFTWQLSGGQQHLTAIAGAIALTPSVLVVDEPVAEVDPHRAQEIYEHLSALNRELGITIVVVEHHAEFVARYARSVVLMADGLPRWHLPVAEALARTEDLEAANIPVPQVTAVARAFEPHGPVPSTVPAAIGWLRDRRLAGPAATGLGQGPVGGAATDSAGADGLVADDPSTSAPVATAVHRGPVIARVERVTRAYRTLAGPRSVVIDGLDLDLHEGERVALVGSNGAGKSTLLKLLSGLDVPDAGSVSVDGTDTRTVSAAELADTVCYLCQRPEEMFLKDSVRADVAMHPAGRRVPGTASLVTEVLDRVDLTSLADRDGRLLSGGQQRRATLAVGLAMRPRLLLLDEPTSSLDLRSRDDVIDMLAALAEHIRCTVIATHDMHLVAEWADRVIVLDQGRVIADTDPRTLFSRQDLLRQARLVPPQVVQLGAALGLEPVPLSVPELVARLSLRSTTPDTAARTDGRLS
ncbi:ATP-binding cassette domain-containing protein [Oerskovia sp. Sa1BUA8]|uniref:ATP-binding cassette domain-containing protein n=1 Tax=Oerskovia douganii TaxID=2762210 RepID=A0A9D5YWP6_9CELL|nr:ABC transporter ATP-binding protein [Oerskovia douganii]MBE7698723.1 ATP-binding cassette domain-containing protein [Oerskovia douganii]